MRSYEVWDDSACEVVKVEASSLDEAIDDYARKIINEAGACDRLDVVARGNDGRWVRVRVSWEYRLDVTLGRAQPCRDPRGEVGE